MSPHEPGTDDADDADFEAGDIVLLNSGSRKMTVERVHEDGVDLVWFHDERICRAPKVAIEALHHVDAHASSR